MAGKTELWLVRHGETEWSLSGAHTSFTDIALTEHGRERARELGAFLKPVHFNAVLTSPLRRARETCDIAGFGGRAVIDDGLREWNYGEFEGKTTRQIREDRGEPEWSVWTDPIVGGEAVEAVGERTDGVIARALEASGGADPSPASSADKSKESDQVRRVALFAHAHILRILAARWVRLPAVDGRLFALGTGSVSVLGFERDTRVITRWNRGFEGE